MSRSALIVLAGVAALCPVAFAAPLSVSILDHDFTFDVPFYDGQGVATGAVYDYAGAGPDVLTLTSPINHHVVGYTYAGLLPTLPPAASPPPASGDPYPLYSGAQFGARLELQMTFDHNDGPYTNPGGDVFDVSLTGSGGLLRITGWVATQNYPPAVQYPPGGGDVPLLEIQFDKVTLLARAGSDTADLIEGYGTVTQLLWADPGDLVSTFPEFAQLQTGTTFFKFILPNPAASVFPLLGGGASYDPLTDYGLAPVIGRASGEAGVPEPATVGLLLLGGLAVVMTRRRRR